MRRIAVVTDTDASLPPQVASACGIRQVPILVQFGHETFETGSTISDAELFARVDREGRMPTTAAPAPGLFAEAFRAAFEEGAEAILCLCVSGEVSATCSAALIARDMLPERDITVVDSRSISMGLGFMALAASDALQAGCSPQEAVEHAIEVREHTCLYATLVTLRYLAMSGRVGHLAAGMAGLLNIKPILTLADGKLEMIERIRSRPRSRKRVLELTDQALGGRRASHMAILHVNALADAQGFEEQVRAVLPCPQGILIAELTPGLSVHTGAGLIGLVTVAAHDQMDYCATD